MKTIWDYFDKTVEHPREVADNPIPYGTVWTYISSTFLNGFINYVKPIGCYVVNRYTREEDDISDRGFYLRTKGDSKWSHFKGIKRELIDIIVSELREVYHTDLSCFGDDIIIVAEVSDYDYNGETEGKYIFFWFDMDAPNCSIGKFQTKDSKEEILKSVENWLTEEFIVNKNHEAKHEDSNGYHKLPLSFLRGWIKF